MKNLKYILERAAECERLAGNTTDPQTRETLLLVASRWRALAGQAEVNRTILPVGGENLTTEEN